MKLQGKVAVVTGGGSGIGRSIAITFAKEGCLVIVAERMEKMGNGVVDEIKKAGGKAFMVKVDVSNSNEVKMAVDNILERYDKIDILVNNAGVGKMENFLEGEESAWWRMMDVNVKGVILFSHAVLKDMVKHNRGKIINIGSDTGLVGLAQQVVYGASKGAVIAFSKGLAAEMGQYNISVNCICPGTIETPMSMLGAKKFPEFFKRVIETSLFKRFGKPEDIAKTVLFLASDDCEFITGQTISVDGGSYR
jgi:NAD(P)-dependent dehydrogenase (short-subunit alcohol dehydrogenase family)